MPSPLATWLGNRRGAFTQQGIYSYNAQGVRFYYYIPPITFEDLRRFLSDNKYATPYYACSYILARKPVTLQNAFHYIASGNLMQRDTEIVNEFSLTVEQLTATLCYQLQNTPQDDVTAEQIQAYVTNHNTLNTKTVIQTITHETQAMLWELLSYFNSEDKKIKLFTTLDGDFNTILLSAFNGTLPYQAFKPLVDFVQANKDLAYFNLAEFALQRNSLGFTIFHLMTKKIAGFCADIFGMEILQKAFIKPDYLGYTPLHHVCESLTEHKLADAKLICSALSALTNHELALTKAFAPSKMGYTPLHLLCMGATATDILVIDYLRQQFALLYKQQLEQADHQGNLPSHYAVKSSSTLLQSLLADLNLAERNKILLQLNQTGATSLDLAVNYGDTTLLEYLVGALGFDQFYEYCKTHTGLAKLAEENIKLAGKFNEMVYRNTVLYVCTAYFLRLKAQHPTEPTYLLRLNDFRACLEHISKQRAHLPPALPDLQYDSSWFFFQTTNEYFELRKHIKTHMQNQLLACKTYFHRLYPDGVEHEIVTSLFGNLRRASMELISTAEPALSLHHQPVLAKA